MMDSLILTHTSNNSSPLIALTGNPNCGKTTLFNQLTGLRHKTGNYPGVTVEKKIGLLKLKNQNFTLIDLPGTYSLLPCSPDEKVVHDILFDQQADTRKPDLLLIVLDANNLERNLYFATQALELNIPSIVVLNMWDMAHKNGTCIDLKELELFLGVPCFSCDSRKSLEVEKIKNHIDLNLTIKHAPLFHSFKQWKSNWPDCVQKHTQTLSTILTNNYPNMKGNLEGEALRLISDSQLNHHLFKTNDVKIHQEINLIRNDLLKQNIQWKSIEADLRYHWIQSSSRKFIRKESNYQKNKYYLFDKFFIHPIWGSLFFLIIMSLIFQSIFTWAEPIMNLFSYFIDHLSQLIDSTFPDSQLKNLVLDGIIAGVGNVLIFLPQIFILFFFIGIFEDSGYMARAAFVLDKIMSKVGLSGKSFLPLLSSFACAIPGILATRTIEDRKDRLCTILIAPLISCSARIPVYTLMIGALIPSIKIWGFFNLQGACLLSMYLLSITTALTMATLFRKTFLKGQTIPFLFELPPYRLPNLKTILISSWDQSKEFIYRAGSIIFCISIVLWFLVNYPKNPEQDHNYLIQKNKLIQNPSYNEKLTALEKEHHRYKMEHSFAGKLGKTIEPLTRYLGFDWKINIGIISSFAAREVLVSTLAIVYQVNEDADATSVDLRQAILTEKSPTTGKPVYTPLVGISVMVFFVLACQCMSTLAIVKKETSSWKWPLFMFGYMSLLAYSGSFIVFQLGKLLGF